MSGLTTVAVAYLGLVALVSITAALGAPLEPAARTGDVVGRVLAGLVVAVDIVSAVRGHRPSDPAVHYAYAGCALVLPLLMSGRPGRTPSLWVVALIAVAQAVVLVRLAATWG